MLDAPAKKLGIFEAAAEARRIADLLLPLRDLVSDLCLASESAEAITDHETTPTRYFADLFSVWSEVNDLANELDRRAKHPMTCETCGGEGRIWKSEHGGNDPDVWDAGRCESCEGKGMVEHP